MRNKASILVGNITQQAKRAGRSITDPQNTQKSSEVASEVS